MYKDMCVSVSIRVIHWMMTYLKDEKKKKNSSVTCIIYCLMVFVVLLQ